MLIQSFLWFLLAIFPLIMAAKGKATITTEEAISMLDLSTSGSKLEGFESESGSLDGDWRQGQDENDEQEADESHSGQITAIDQDHTSTQLTDDDDDDGSGSLHRGSHDSEVDDGETSAKLTHATVELVLQETTMTQEKLLVRLLNLTMTLEKSMMRQVRVILRAIPSLIMKVRKRLRVVRVCRPKRWKNKRIRLRKREKNTLLFLAKMYVISPNYVFLIIVLLFLCTVHSVGCCPKI